MCFTKMSKEHEKNENDDTDLHQLRHIEIRRSAFQKSLENKLTSNLNKNELKVEEKSIKTCFEISKQSKIPSFEKWKNYYIEYWSVFKKNEVVLAKIKETSLEINCMKAHLDELKALDNKK